MTYPLLMKYQDQETAYRVMLETGSQEFEETFRLPHLTLCVNEATGESQYVRSEAPLEDGLLRKVAEIGKTENK